jgi:hypothetical protein
VGDQVMVALVLDGDALTTDQFEAFLAAQPDLSPKAWPRFVRINDDLPRTATNKILKRELSAQGVTAGDGVLWERPGRGTAMSPSNRQKTLDRLQAWGSWISARIINSWPAQAGGFTTCPRPCRDAERGRHVQELAGGCA